ncbi:glycosyltransferase family 2 protein [Ornithinibacillus contaminans]|uniref:glycosyltransferase family 2 protein n=1 Tax=Ornithinibacillus contaminans TaxID=694055 RepID=UPI00064DEC06|nr:glycosyltransferase family 2 protein [Ornithinibacillus contaminans]
MSKLEVAVIIPALNPLESLINYTHELLANGIAHVIVVNDGSTADVMNIFTALSALDHCTVIHHDKNKGKGTALKTAFTYYINHFHHLNGVVTADADSQHAIGDVLNLATTLVESEHGLLLGVRNFQLDYVPPKSKFGNTITSLFFHLLYGKKLTDTQTGLRGIPTSELDWMIAIKGERYEYEINMLIHAVKRSIPLIELHIETIYYENNSRTYFKAIKDSSKIFTKLVAGSFRKSSYFEPAKGEHHAK